VTWLCIPVSPKSFRDTLTFPRSVVEPVSKRKLKRQLGLLQVVMLGTAGTIAAEIFVLTGHAAGISGPAAVLAMLIGGLLSYAVALNYCELGTAFPTAGGAMSYVREAFGDNILFYLVGSMDCISSTFYAALSAVGFAYMLQVFIPVLPIVPVAIIVIFIFTLLNIGGAAKAGLVQIILGSVLLASFAAFIVVGFLHPNGFSWSTFVPQGRLFIGDGFGKNLALMLATIALLYNAYVGFEVIVDDAEEVSNPGQMIPRGILISLTLTTVIYVLVAMVTQGTIPWQQLAHSTTPLIDAVRRFMPGVGVPLMTIVGMIATLTSINSAMLSATREAFTLGRDGVWPNIFSRLSAFRTPVFSIAIIGTISALVASIGLVDFLSYISSSGYLFVLFFGSMSLVRLRKKYPNIERPFKVPFYPFTVYMAMVACVLIIAFADWRAILFGFGVIAVFAGLYALKAPFSRYLDARAKATSKTKDLILIAASHPQTIRSLVHIASIIALASEDSYACVLSVRKETPAPPGEASPMAENPMRSPSQGVLRQALAYAQAYNMALYTKERSDKSVAHGILDEVNRRSNVKMILTGWPGQLNPSSLVENHVKVLLQRAPTNVVSLLDRGLSDIRRILVPIGGGPHSRLAIRLAYEIAMAEDAQITALRLLTPKEKQDDEDLGEEIEDKTTWLAEIIQDELGFVPESCTLQVRETGLLSEGILEEASNKTYDLVVLGASEQWALSTRLFGSVGDWIADNVPCSVLLCRRYEPITMSWIRQRIKSFGNTYEEPEQRPCADDGSEPLTAPNKT
ncbi:MAG: amino acid permease, partial [Anaerolineae bacterium]